MNRIIAPAMLALAAGCGSQTASSGAGGELTALATAEAVLADSTGRRVGVATFIQRGDGVSIGVSVTGLPPGAHGLHIHERGVCEPPSFESAGDHFAPEDRSHGSEAEGGPHAGDLPNLTVGEHRTGRLGTQSTLVTLGEGDNSLLDDDGSALVIHARADDYRTQPSGGSGDRIACGVIQPR